MTGRARPAAAALDDKPAPALLAGFVFIGRAKRFGLVERILGTHLDTAGVALVVRAMVSACAYRAVDDIGLAFVLVPHHNNTPFPVGAAVSRPRAFIIRPCIGDIK